MHTPRRPEASVSLPDKCSSPCFRCSADHVRRSDYCSKRCADRARGRDWRNKNHRRRTKTRVTDLTAADIRVLIASRTYCPICKKHMTITDGPLKKHLDHIIPIGIGGTHTLGNVRVICATCNLSRPKDASDLDLHQPTLWATDERAAIAASVLRNERIRTRPKASLRVSKAQARPICRRLRAQLAYLYRLNGATWNEIVDRFGFSSPGHAHNVVYGGDRRAYAPARTNHFKGRRGA